MVINFFISLIKQTFRYIFTIIILFINKNPKLRSTFEILKLLKYIENMTNFSLFFLLISLNKRVAVYLFNADNEAEKYLKCLKNKKFIISM